MPFAKVCRIIFASILIFAQTAIATPPATEPAVKIDHAGLVKLHWQLAAQASTFRDETAFTMIDQLHAMGVHHISLAPGQTLSDDFPNIKITSALTPDQLDSLRAKLKSVGMDIVSFGPVTITNNDDQNMALFNFAKNLKVKNLIAIPTTVSMETLDKLATSSRIHVAILTQFDPGWSCQTFLQLVEGRSASIGFCLDVAALRRTGSPIDPCVQTLGERLLEINLTDQTDDTDRLRSMLNELRQKNFRGVFEVQSSIGSGAKRADHFVSAVNAFSQAVSEAAK